MPLGLLIFLYTLIFLALYTQVFFLVSFFDHRKTIKKQEARVFSDDVLPAVTFVIPCWNESETVCNTIESLLKLDYPSDRIHVLAIDDGSTDDTWHHLQRFTHHDHVQILQKKNGGKYDALNFALPHVATPYFCAIDADTVITPLALRTIVGYACGNSKMSAVAGTVLINKPSTFTQKAQNIEYQMFSFSKKVLGLLDGVLVAPGAFSLFNTGHVREVGGYREAHNMEDLELTYRLQVNGYKVDHCHNAIAYTKGPDSIKALFKQRLRWGYGFINNTKDYRKTILNKKFGNFGMFTLPMSIMAYALVVVMFFSSWYYMITFLIDSLMVIKLSGIDTAVQQVISFDWFFINIDAFFFLSALMYVSVVLVIILGRRTSKLSMMSNLTHIVWFFVIYTFLAPFWIVASVMNVIRSVQPRWR